MQIQPGEILIANSAGFTFVDLQSILIRPDLKNASENQSCTMLQPEELPLAIRVATTGL